MDAEARAGVQGPLSELLFVAGEASGDRLAAEVLRCYAGPAFGLGGALCAAAGAELAVDLQTITGAGLGDAARRLPRVLSAFATLRRLVRRRRPRAALLVDYVEANAIFGRWLRRAGVPVLWCVAPQTWAWRSNRVRRLAGSMDRLAVLFRFEVEAWRAAGVDARWVGHPAVEGTAPDRRSARRALGLPEAGHALALLPGSRPREVERHLPSMIAAARALGLPARVLVARSLDDRARAMVARLAREVPLVAIEPASGLRDVLPAFDVAIAAAGTATLECALSSASPVVACRTDRLAAALFGRLIETPHLALPNVLLGARAYPELWQDAATPEALAGAVRAMLRAPIDHREALRAALDPHDGSTFGARVRELLVPWI